MIDKLVDFFVRRFLARILYIPSSRVFSVSLLLKYQNFLVDC